MRTDRPVYLCYKLNPQIPIVENRIEFQIYTSSRGAKQWLYNSLHEGSVNRYIPLDNEFHIIPDRVMLATISHVGRTVDDMEIVMSYVDPETKQRSRNNVYKLVMRKCNVYTSTNDSLLDKHDK